MSDTLLFWIFFGAIMGFVGVSEILAHFELLTREFTRKLVHVGVGILILIAIQAFHDLKPLMILSALFVVLNAAALVTGIFRGIHEVERQTWGTVFFPLAVLTNTWLFGTSRTILSASLIPMFFSDALAAIVGKSYPWIRFRSLGKSLGGTLTFIASTWILWGFLFRGHLPLMMIFLAGVLAMAELGLSGGFDNWIIPLLAGIWLTAFDRGIGLIPMLEAAGWSLLIAGLAYQTKALTLDGALITGVMGMLILGLGGVQYLLPILVFFGTSSLLTKLIHGKSNVKAGESRDGFQVLANGGLASLIVVLSYLKIVPIDLYPIYLAVLAVVNSDTWSTEIGSLSRTDPRSILLFRKVPKGTSGAISLIGTLGGILGSFLIATVGLGYGYPWSTILIVTVVGVLGNLLDSVLGATVEVRYRCQECGGLFDVEVHCNLPTVFSGGLRWFNNNWVNFSASLAGGALAILAVLLIG